MAINDEGILQCTRLYRIDPVIVRRIPVRGAGWQLDSLHVIRIRDRFDPEDTLVFRLDAGGAAR